MCNYDPSALGNPAIGGDGWVMPKYVLPGGLPSGAVIDENYAAGNSIQIKIASLDPPALYIGGKDKDD